MFIERSTKARSAQRPRVGWASCPPAPASRRRDGTLSGRNFDIDAPPTFVTAGRDARQGGRDAHPTRGPDALRAFAGPVTLVSMETKEITAIRRFDEENARDPKQYELPYSIWLSDWVRWLAPEASEALRLAARCQHLCRWEIPRESYPMDRAGYLKWRADLKKFHAQKSAEILTEAGYDAEIIERVQALNLKKNLGCDPEMQVLEDALCLVTLQHQLAELMAKHDEEKMIGIVRKTWKKMSPGGRDAALNLPYSEAEIALLQRALKEDER
jgi:hypothetical protein